MADELLRRLDTIQKELREGLGLMELREQVREANFYQTTVQTLTGEMIAIATAFEERLKTFEDGRLAGMEERLAGIEERLLGIEMMLDDIARKLEISPPQFPMNAS
jgi:hypothetical protein